MFSTRFSNTNVLVTLEVTFKFEIVKEIPGVSEIICNTGGDAPLNTFAVTSTFEELEPKLILSANS